MNDRVGRRKVDPESSCPVADEIDEERTVGRIEHSNIDGATNTVGLTRR